MNSMTTSILSKLFETHRLVFWYDAEKSLGEEFEALTLPDVEKLVIDNNEFGIKVRVLHEQPTQKFLLYHRGARPEDEANWLLDLLLANTEFCTQKSSARKSLSPISITELRPLETALATALVPSGPFG